MKGYTNVSWKELLMELFTFLAIAGTLIFAVIFVVLWISFYFWVR